MIRIRETFRRNGRRLFVLGAIALISAVVLWAHSAPGGRHMPMPDHEMGAAIGVCLAVLEAGTVLLLGIGLSAIVRRQRRSFAPQPMPALPLLTPSDDSPARPRAGPALLQVFLR
jgi:hypothetical protein